MLPTCNLPGLMKAFPPSPSLNRGTWRAIAKTFEIPILFCAVDEEPEENAVSHSTVRSTARFDKPVRGRVRFIRPNVPWDRVSDSYQGRPVGRRAVQTNVCP